MRLVIGTYRKRKHVEAALDSISRHVTGITDITIVDDSGDSEHREWLAQLGHVIPVHPTENAGYTAAMSVVAAAFQGQAGIFWEEDFVAVQDIDLNEIAEMLYHRPNLAQIILLRGAHFPVEHEHGGVVEALEAKGHTITRAPDGLIYQRATFSCNPAVTRGEVWAAGWPSSGRWTEEIKRDELLRDGYSFAWLAGQTVEHSGERSGHGY